MISTIQSGWQDEVEAASSAAQGCLRRRLQRRPEDPGAFWSGELEADITLETDYAQFLYILDPERFSDKIQRLCRNVIKRQLPDGSWNIFHEGSGDVSATVKAYTSLRLAGYSPDEPFMRKARNAVLALGGAERVNSFTKFNLALLGQIGWDEVPSIPPEVILLPRFAPVNVYEISYWSRAILIPLTILYSHKFHRKPPEGDLIAELFHDRAAVKTSFSLGSIGQRIDLSRLEGDQVELSDEELRAFKNELSETSPGIVSWENFFLTSDRLLKVIEKMPIKPLRKMALKKAEDWVVARLEGSDGLGAIFPSMVYAVLALRALDYPIDHPKVEKELLEFIELEVDEGEILRMQPCLSPIWDSALAVLAMHESGVEPSDPDLVDCGRWLVDREVRRPGDWQLRMPKVDVGGWPFQFRNDFYPDIDDTAAVVMALGRLDKSQVDGAEDAILRGIRWVSDMQSSSGGWAAFDVDIEKEFLTKVPYADHNAMLDPPCADVTGRCLEMFGRFSELLSDKKIRDVVVRGVDYLKQTQESDGAWFGRWGVNYIYGTWQALKGLIAVGESATQPYIQKATHFLASHQNEDGGWGESCSSYDHDATGRSFRGRGDSTPSQTAWAVMGLISAGQADSDAVRSGIRYLTRTQREDGDWDEELWTGTGFPCVFYLRYHYYRLYFPLFALGMYKCAKTNTQRLRTGEWSDLQDRIGLEPQMGTRRRKLLQLLKG